MAIAKLTKRLVDDMPVPGAAESWTWDSEIKGFGLKITPTGRKVFFLKYRPRGSRTTAKLQLGPYGPLTVEQARDQARRALGAVIGGSDPARDRSSRRQAPTVAEALDDYLADFSGRWKPRTAHGYHSNIKPWIGSRKVADLSREDVGGLLRSLRETPVLANRVQALISAFMTHAIRSGLRADGQNPAKHLPRHKEIGRTRFLSGEEIGRLGNALQAAERGTWTDKDGKALPPAPWQSIAAIRLLALTGCRRNEILDLRWAEVDLSRGVLLLQDTKSGRSVRPLNGTARKIIESLKRGSPDERVLPGTKGRRHEVKYAWEKVRRVAELKAVRLHDLRHTLASRSQHEGHSLLTTGSLLGHKNLATTQKYAHLVDDPIKQAADRLGADIGALLEGSSTAVVPIGAARAQKRGSPRAK